MVVVDPRVLWMPRTLVKGEEFIRDLIPWCSIFIEEGNPIQSEANGAVGRIGFCGWIVRTDWHFHDNELFRYLVVPGRPWNTWITCRSFGRSILVKIRKEIKQLIQCMGRFKIMRLVFRPVRRFHHHVIRTTVWIRVLGTDMKRIVRIGIGVFGDRRFVRRRNVGEVVRAATNGIGIGAAAIWITSVWWSCFFIFFPCTGNDAQRRNKNDSDPETRIQEPRPNGSMNEGFFESKVWTKISIFIFHSSLCYLKVIPWSFLAPIWNAKDTSH